MASVVIKHREFEIVKEVSEHSFIANYKNKQYFIRKFTPKSEEGDLLTYSLKRITTSGIKAPKLFWVDKKAGYVVSEYLEITPVTDILASGKIEEDLYDQLFKSAHYARVNFMTINYEPMAWGLSNGELYYLGTTFTVYKKSDDLVDKYLRLWFNTRELANYLEKNGIFYDKSHLKDEYSVNKEIVLMSVKYYR